MILASTKSTDSTTNPEYRCTIPISISNSKFHDQDIENLQVNPNPKPKAKWIYTKSTPINLESCNFFQPIWLSRACLTIVISQSLAPSLSILRLKPTTILSEISQLDGGIHSFSLQCFKQRRRLCLHISKQLKLEWNFNTLIC